VYAFTHRLASYNRFNILKAKFQAKENQVGELLLYKQYLAEKWLGSM
jgi:hypothetical protein